MSGRYLAFGAALASAAAATSEAHAREPGRGGAKWYVEAAESCAEARADLEEEIRLACAAVETCRVVTSKDAAELHATLTCAEGAWSLETKTAEGATIARIELEGTISDRLRGAAMEVARDVAPERSLVVESLRDAMPGTDEGKTKLGEAAARLAPPFLSLAAGGRGSVAAGSAAAGGARLLGGARIGRLTHWTASAAYQTSGAARTRSDVRAGTGLAFGAPLAPVPVGFLLDDGLAFDNARDESLPGRFGPRNQPGARMGTYAEATLVVQVPDGPLRPYAGVSAAVATVATTFTLGGELGFAFPVF